MAVDLVSSVALPNLGLPIAAADGCCSCAITKVASGSGCGCGGGTSGAPVLPPSGTPQPAVDGADGAWNGWPPGAQPRYSAGAGPDALDQIAALTHAAQARALDPVRAAVYPQVPVADS